MSEHPRWHQPLALRDSEGLQKLPLVLFNSNFPLFANINETVNPDIPPTPAALKIVKRNHPSGGLPPNCHSCLVPKQYLFSGDLGTFGLTWRWDRWSLSTGGGNGGFALPRYQEHGAPLLSRALPVGSYPACPMRPDLHFDLCPRGRGPLPKGAVCCEAARSHTAI